LDVACVTLKRLHKWIPNLASLIIGNYLHVLPFTSVIIADEIGKSIDLCKNIFA